MNINKVTGIYFSPCGHTEYLVRLIAEQTAKAFEVDCDYIDITTPAMRQRSYEFGNSDLVVIGIPIYAGRVPNKIMPDIKEFVKGADTPAILVCTFGNRSYGTANDELQFIAEANSFKVAASCAMTGEHVLSDKLGRSEAGLMRPDESDLNDLRPFVDGAIANIKGDKFLAPASEDAVAPYYRPLRADGQPAVFLKSKPVTDAARCDRCGLCAGKCSMGSISPEDPAVVTGVCIKCQACVKHCPKGAKFFDNEDLISHIKMLEEHFARPTDNMYKL